MISNEEMGTLDRMVYCGAVTELEAANIARKTIGLPALSQAEFDALTACKDLQIRKLAAENAALISKFSEMRMDHEWPIDTELLKPPCRVKKSWQWWKKK